MAYENAAKKIGKKGEWAKHMKPAGKRASAKIIRRALRKRAQDER